MKNNEDIFSALFEHGFLTFSVKVRIAEIIRNFIGNYLQFLKFTKIADKKSSYFLKYEE